jgi:hypothetical protein
MSVIERIETNDLAVKSEDLYEKEDQFWSAVEDDLDCDARFRHWLFFVRRIFDEHPRISAATALTANNITPTTITPEIWADWQAAKASYKPEYRPHPGYGPQDITTFTLATPEWLGRIDYKQPFLNDPIAVAAAEERAAKASAERQAAAEAERVAEAKAAERQAAEDRRLAALVAKLQAYEFKPIELESVDYKKLHALKKHPDKSKRDLAQRWTDRFEALPDNVQLAWQAFFEVITIGATPALAPADDDEDDNAERIDTEPQIVHLIPIPPNERRDIYDGVADAILSGLRDPAFRDFRRFSTGVRRLVDLIGNPIDDVIDPPADAFRPEPAEDVDDIADGGKLADIVPEVIPSRGLTVVHGEAKYCKSSFLHKLAVVIADDKGATFEGIEVEHGSVIFATLDPGAERKVTKPRILAVRDRLGLKPSGRLCLTDAPLILNEPTSVAHWLELNKARLPCKLIVVDSLFSATAGSLAQDTVVQGVMDGVRMLLRHAEAVAAVHHDNRSGDIFGSAFLGPMLVSKMHVQRPGFGERVTVTVDYVKNGTAREQPFSYRLQGPFLASSGEAAGSAAMAHEGIKRPDILALLPGAPTAVSKARKLIEDKLSGKTPKSRDEEWRRLRLHWAERGVVIVKDGTIRRVE